MAVVVAIPVAPSGPERDRLHRWTIATWKREGLTPRTAGDGQAGEVTTDRFSHTRAINAAVGEGDPSDVLVIADADTFPDPDSILPRVSLAADGHWSCPARYVNLNWDVTNGIVAHETRFSQAVARAELKGGHIWEGETSWAGVVVIRRDQFDLVGGYDERFTGWAADDIAFAMSVETLVGPVTRMGTVYHLHHDAPRARTYDRPGYQEAWKLTRRYMNAHGKQKKMARLIEERNNGTR